MELWKSIEPLAGKDVVNVIIEISKGSKNKYELDKKTGLIKLDRVLYSAMHYPLDYGLIPKTYCEDGDPLDILVISTESLLPGVLVEARVIGAMRMIDSGEQDDKLIGVVAEDPRLNHINDIEDVGEHTLKEIRHFFEHYKDLQGKKVEVKEFLGKQQALKILKDSISLYNQKFK